MINAVLWAKSNPLIGDVFHRRYDDTPITLTRNQAVRDARNVKADFLLMLDSDMWPDIGLDRHNAIQGARPFLPTAFEFAVNHPGPCVIGAPYCGPPPDENVYIFLPCNRQSGSRDKDFKLEMISREHAAQRIGIEEVAALPTGLILFDMRAFDSIPKNKPPFDYEFSPDGATKLTTEDVFTTRNMMLIGVPQYVTWDCWAGHHKRKCVTKPQPWTMDAVRKEYREAIVRGQLSTEALMVVGEGKPKKSYSVVLSQQDAACLRKELEARQRAGEPNPHGGILGLSHMTHLAGPAIHPVTDLASLAGKRHSNAAIGSNEEPKNDTPF